MSEFGDFIISGFKGTEFNRELERRLLVDKIGGLIFFSRNIASRRQVKNLINSCRAARDSVSKTPLIMAVDHEGAPVHRFGSLVDELPSHAAFAKSKLKRYAAPLWQGAAEDLASLGFNANFAPVLDVGRKGKSSAMGIRSFGCEKKDAIGFGAEFMEGMRRGRISCFAKHFPGLGKTGTDSHFSLPVIGESRRKLLDEDAGVFKSLIKRELVDGILLAHAVYPRLDMKFPASMSRKIITGLLYGKLKFNGVAVTDDIDMLAIRKNYETGYFARKSVEAGAHFILACHNKSPIQKIFAGLAGIKPETLESRLRSIRSWKENILSRKKPQRPGAARRAGDYAWKIAGEAASIKIKNKIGRKNHIFLCFIPQAVRGDRDILRIKKMLKTRIDKTFPGAGTVFYPAAPAREDLEKKTPVIITYNAYKDKKMLGSVMSAIEAAGKNCYCLAVADPVDSDYFDSCAGAGCSYSPDIRSVSELLRMLKEKENEK
ncbi:MAG: hypothetical protein JW728_06380 [Candidatus Aureabacteria bacterium]|nr:hypothetical protein [Candidatus Auribacterota bacterium]